MVMIPAGKFIMGSPDDEPGRDADEGPRHEVTIAKPFAVSKYEVTFHEWDACVAAAACQKIGDRWGRGQMPVINVSWDDAKTYVAWLSWSTGKEYRLLTEAEWEYAARAGTTTFYFWGDDPGKGNANCDGCGNQWDRKQTVPAGSFEPNAFGLYDMHGNVWEWCEDIWHENYDGVPGDGSAWLANGDPSLRVVRGGSWSNDSQILRVAIRIRSTSVYRYSNFGFRVARTLTPCILIPLPLGFRVEPWPNCFEAWHRRSTMSGARARPSRLMNSTSSGGQRRSHPESPCKP